MKFGLARNAYALMLLVAALATSCQGSTVPATAPAVSDTVKNGPMKFGIFRPSSGNFALRATLTQGPPDLGVKFGQAEDFPLIGDWDGKGTSTIGVYRPGDSTFHLLKSNKDGADELTIPFGMKGDLPVVGDWDGNGTVTIGTYRPSNSTFYLRNSICHMRRS